MSGSYQPGATYKSVFTTSNPTTGAAQDADSLPSASAFRNGVVDSGWSLTVADIGVGRYSISGTVPSGYAENDRVDVVASATVGGVAAAAVVDRFQVQAGLAAIETGTAQAIGSSSITLKNGSTLTSAVVGTGIVSLDSGPGSGQWRRITAVDVSVPTAIVVTVDTPWYGSPSSPGYSITSEANVPANLQTIKGQTVVCAGTVTIPAATLASTTNIAAASGVALAGAGLDAIVVETGVNARQSLSAILASATGVLSGAVAAGSTGTTLLKNPAGTETRASVVLDGEGNRTSVSLNLPA